MSRRFTETAKWNDGWFANLSNEHKLAWLYILDTCTPAGRWIKNFKLLNFNCNSRMEKAEFESIFGNRVIYVEKGDYYLIPKFLRYQYPKGIYSRKPAIKAVQKEVVLYGLKSMIKQSLGNDYLIISQSLGNDKTIVLDKDKDKDKDKEQVEGKYKDKSKDKSKSKDAVGDSDDSFCDDDKAFG